MVVLRQYLPRPLAKSIEALFTQVVMVLVVGPFVFIFFYMVWSSVKPDYLFYEPGTWIFEPTLYHYQNVIGGSDLIGNIRNSLIVSSAASLIGVICGIMTAYTIARYKLRKLAMAILVTRMIPYITALIPLWMMYNWLNLLNTYTGLILSHLVITIPFGVWILIAYIEDIPQDLEDAALIDGASRTQVFWKIVLPLCRPGIIATTILCFIFSWNNFQLALILGGIDVNTAPVSVFKFAGAETGSMGAMMAGATLVTIPVFVIVMFVQKHLAAGLTAGGISK
ncbi:MAG TPA: carbohydrate ABC transporter permease [Geminicoccaceae bacterium]|nr:carbohydrate ABC transporter permease [Geminicoccaceae bacterium]